MEGIRRKLRALLPGTGDDTLDIVVDVVASSLGRLGGRPRGVPYAGIPVGETPSAQLTKPANGAQQEINTQGSVLSLSDSGFSKQSGSVEGESDGPALVVFATAGKTKSWAFRSKHLAMLTDAFPALDVLVEVKRAWVWVEANPRNQKTAGGMMKFLLGWMGRAQDGRRGSGPNGNGNGRDVTRGWAAPTGNYGKKGEQEL